MRKKSFAITLLLSAFTLCACPAQRDNTIGWDKLDVDMMRKNLHGYVFPRYEKAESIDVGLDLKENYGDEENPLYVVFFDAQNCVKQGDIGDYIALLKEEGFFYYDLSRYNSMPKGTIFEFRKKVDEKHYIGGQVYSYVEENKGTEDEPVYVKRYSEEGNFYMTAGDIFDYEYPEEEVNSRINLLSYNYNVSGDPVNYPPAIEADYYEVDSHSLYAYSDDNTRGFMDDYIGKLVGEGWAESYNNEFDSYTLVPQDEDYLLEIYFDNVSKRAVIDYQTTKLDPTPEPVESDYWETSLIGGFFNEYGQTGFIIPEPTNFSDVKYTYYEDINNSYCQHEGFEHLMCFYIEAEGVTQEEYQAYTLNLYFNEGWQLNEEPLYFYKDVGDGCGKMEITYNEDTNFLMFKVYIYTFYMHYTSWPSEVIRNNLLAYNSDFTDTLPVFTGSFDYIVTYANIVEIHSEYAYDARLSYESRLSGSGFTEIDHGTDHFRSPNEKYDVFLGLFEDHVKVEIRSPEDSGHGETTTYAWPSDLLYEALKGAYGLIPTIEDADEYVLYIGGNTEEPYGDISCKYFNKTQNEIISMGETYIERLENEGFYKVNENGYADAGEEIYLEIIYGWSEEYGYVGIFFDTDVTAHK